MDFDKVIEKLQEEINYAKDNFVPIIRDKSAEFLYNYVKENNIKKNLQTFFFRKFKKKPMIMPIIIETN